jgi:hypothetical protein
VEGYNTRLLASYFTSLFLKFQDLALCINYQYITHKYRTPYTFNPHPFFRDKPGKYSKTPDLFVYGNYSRMWKRIGILELGTRLPAGRLGIRNWELGFAAMTHVSRLTIAAMASFFYDIIQRLLKGSHHIETLKCFSDKNDA